MKKIIFCTFLMSLLFFSCKKKEKNISIYSYSLLNDDVGNFKLNITEKGGVIGFEYLNKIDTIGRLHLTYNKKLDVLITKADTFYSTKKAYNLKEIKFKFYKRKVVKSHTRSLVFNEKYGLLSNLAFGADYLFIKDSISKIEKEVLFKGVFLKLNEINVE